MSDPFVINLYEKSYHKLADKIFHVLDSIGLTFDTIIVPDSIIDLINRSDMRIIFKTTVSVREDHVSDYRLKVIEKKLETVAIQDILKSDRKCEQLIFESVDDWLLFKLALE